MGLRKGVAGAGGHGGSKPYGARDETGSDRGSWGAVLACLSLLARRVGAAIAKEPGGALAPFSRALVAPRRFERLGAELCRHKALDLKLLLGGERQKLVGGLLRLDRKSVV